MVDMLNQPRYVSSGWRDPGPAMVRASEDLDSRNRTDAGQRDLFGTGDGKAFIKHGRRKKLEVLLQTRILTPSEFEGELGATPDAAP